MCVSGKVFDRDVDVTGGRPGRMRTQSYSGLAESETGGK